jgi:hypothetical protein
MSEQLLNLAWVVIAIVSFAALLPRRRDVRAIAVLAFMLALLFPIVSATDDISGDRSLEQAVAVLAVIAVAFTLMVVARLELESRSVPAFLLTPEAGTRAPPRV